MLVNYSQLLTPKAPLTIYGWNLIKKQTNNLFLIVYIVKIILKRHTLNMFSLHYSNVKFISSLAFVRGTFLS